MPRPWGILLVLKVGLPSSGNLFWKHPHIHPQRWASQTPCEFLNPTKLTLKITITVSIS